MTTTTLENPQAATRGFIDQLIQERPEQAAAENGAMEVSPEQTATQQPAPESPESDKPRSSKDWDSFKAKSKERETALQSELEQVKKDLATARQAAPATGTSPEVEELKRQRDDLETRLKTAAVQFHPKFQEYYGGRFAKQYDAARDVVGGALSDRLVTILKEPDSQWRQQQIENFAASENLTPLQNAQLGNILIELSKINRDRESDLKKAEQTWTQLVEKEKQTASQRMETQKKQYESAFFGVLDKLRSPDAEVSHYRPREGDEAWNSAVQKRVDDAVALFTGKGTLEGGIKTVLLGLAAPDLISEHKNALAEIKKLQMQIQELTTATPKVQSAGSSSTATEGQPIPVIHRPGSSPSEATQSWVRSLQNTP